MPCLTEAMKRAALAAAPEATESSADDWSKAVATQGGGVEATIAELRRKRGQRGPQQTPKKIATALRLDAEALARWRASGKGWQTRAAALLAKYAP